MNRVWLLVIGCWLLIASCQQKDSSQEVIRTYSVRETTLPMKYAKGFSVDYYSGFKVVTVKDWRDSTKMFAQYILVPQGDPIPANFRNSILINTPVRKIVCISTNHIAELSRLNLADSIAGVANVNLIYNEEIVNRVRESKVADLGNEELNYEKLVELSPSFVLTSGDWDGGDKMKVKLNSLHIKSVLNLDYMEQEPLARAEWLKFISVFYDKEQDADSIFNHIEMSYLSLKDKAINVTSKPTAFSNLPFKEVWYMPCGENYMAKLIADAGGDFLWKDASATNGLNLNLDYEAVYNKAVNADYWVNAGFAKSLQEIKAADKKNIFFKAYKKENIYNNDKRNTTSGGFDFWESGAVNPDKVLADLIFIFHPGLLPDHELYYYRKLK